MQEKLSEIFAKLDSIYSQMPETIGCVGCGKCCSVQHPHCYYVEFLYMMDEIGKWEKEKSIELHIACLSNYLNTSINKKCVFLNKDKRCEIYKVRDYNCRAFGITPKKIYAQRVADVKKRFPGIRLGLEKQSDCCGGVRPAEYIGGNKLNSLFEQILELDKNLDVSKENIRDANNYMTFHDHYLLFHYGNSVDMLKNLTWVKENATEEDKQKFLCMIRESLNNKEKING